MGGMFSQVFWKQAWTPEAESVLRQALVSQRCSIRELSSQQWEPSTATIGGIADHMTSYLAPASEAWSSVTLHLNSLVFESVAEELSRLTSGPAIAISDFHQETWGYSLFESGKLLDRFWNSPSMSETPPEEWVGNVPALVRVFGVMAETIAPYLCHITTENCRTKVFDDDESVLGDHWVRLDFMRKLGIPYPSPGEVAGSRYVQIEEPRSRFRTTRSQLSDQPT